MSRYLWAIVCLLSIVTMAPAQVRGGMPVRSPRPAQVFPVNPYFRYPPPVYTLPQPVLPVNPNYWVAPGLTLNQYAYNQAVMGRALSNYPPWVFGYNPYPQFINYGPMLYNPYAMNPYANPYVNPYAAYGAYYYNPYAFMGY